jgi:hypothetical protein
MSSNAEGMETGTSKSLATASSATGGTGSLASQTAVLNDTPFSVLLPARGGQEVGHPLRPLSRAVAAVRLLSESAQDYETLILRFTDLQGL